MANEELPPDEVLEALTAPDPVAPAEPDPAPVRAIRMEPAMGAQMFTPEDPRAGAYEAGKVYRIPEDVSPEKAAALLAGGGYVATDPE